MSIQQEYRTIFEREILQKSKSIIFSYSPLQNTYRYIPYSHSVSPNAVEELAELMRHDIFFYAFSEEEIVRYYKQNLFASLETASKFAYRQRLPSRADITDGLPSEVLLDLLVQLYNPSAYKLAVRTILRQNDNNEIKGYDLTYFTKDSSGISLWLGQAKLGRKDYCKSSIHEDLTLKYTSNYLSEQLFFISDKPMALTDDARAILDTIQALNVLMINDDPQTRFSKLISYFRTNNIKFRIPCLLAYGNNSVYSDAYSIDTKIQDELSSIKNYYEVRNYSSNLLDTEIIFYVFPIESIERLRNKETGFYAGLC